MVGRLLPDLAGPRRRAAAGDDRRRRRTAAARPTRLGRADLHIHTSPPTGRPNRRDPRPRRAATDLDVIAITDHERIDAALAARTMARTGGCRVEVIVGEEVTTRGGDLLALFIEQPIRPLRSLRSTIAADPRRGRPGHPRPSARAVPAVRPGLRPPPPARRPDPPSGPTASRRSTRRRSAGRGTRGSSGSPTRRAGPDRQQRCPRARRRSAPAGRRSRGGPPADLRRGHRARQDPATRAFHGTRPGRDFGRQLRKCARDARDEVARQGPARRDGARPGYPGGRAPAAALRAGARAGRGPPMKIGLVCPYIYPLPGGVAQHVRYLYENLRLRGHDVRIITASHGLQRSSEGDVIRLGTGFSRADQRLGRDADGLAALLGQVRRRARARAVRRPPLPRAVRAVPVADPAPRLDQRERRHVPRLRRLLAVVRVRQPGAAAATRSGSTAGSRSARRPATSSTATSRATTRSSPTASTSTASPSAVPLARWQDGTPEPAVRRPPRAAQGPARPPQGLPDPAQDRLPVPAARGRLGPAGARGAALRRDPPPPGRRVPGPGRTPRRPSCSRPPTSTSRPRPAASRSGSSCSRRWPPGTPIVCLATSTATRASSGAAARACSCRRASRKRAGGAIGRLLRDPALRSQMGAGGQARAEEFSWPRVTAKVEDYYGFVIRRLAARAAARRVPAPRSLRRRRRSGPGRRAPRRSRSAGRRRPDRPGPASAPATPRAPAARPRPSRRRPGRSPPRRRSGRPGRRRRAAASTAPRRPC